MFTRKEDEAYEDEPFDNPISSTSEGNKKNLLKSALSTTPDANVISKGTATQGDIYCENDIIVFGEVTGRIYSKSKVMVGKGGFVNGKIECSKAEIYGQVEGTLTVQNHLFFSSDAKIDGDVLTAHLEMEPTAKFNGKCTMKDKVTLSEPPLPGRNKSMKIPAYNKMNKTSGSSSDKQSSGQSNKGNTDSVKNEKITTGVFQK